MADTVAFRKGRDEVVVGDDQPLPVAQSVNYVDVTLTPDTSIFASGDVIADTQVVTNAVAQNDGKAILQSIVVIDEDDQKAAIDIYFFSGSGALGTENSAPGISDANARNFLGWQAIATGDYKDLGGVSVAMIKGIGLPIKAASGTRDIYVGVVNGAGTPTYTASGLKLRLGFQQA
jgi:hypothetical protein